VSEKPLFDQYSDSYDSNLNHALAATGEDKEYFARGRVAWLSRCLSEMHVQPKLAMDYGCGIGSTVPVLWETLKLEEIVAVDVSGRSLATAREKHNFSAVRYAGIEEYRPQGTLDLVYCNGVFHHIPKAERPAAFAYVRESLKPGGFFAFWENNPWSPATRYVMSRCAFDKDAQMLSVSEAKIRLKDSGFAILSCDFLFVFPRFLKPLQSTEPILRKLPVGAQYQILARKS